MVYAEHLLSFRSSEFSYILEKGCLCDQPAIKTWALSLSWPFLVDNISLMLSQVDAGGIKHVLWDSTRRELLETCACLPSDFVHAPFSSTDFTLYPVTVINRTLECNYKVLWVLLLNHQTWRWSPITQLTKINVMW